jgi:hypothetical protein
MKKNFFLSFLRALRGKIRPRNPACRKITFFASGGQGGFFRENRPVNHLDPLQKRLVDFIVSG